MKGKTLWGGIIAVALTTGVGQGKEIGSLFQTSLHGKPPVFDEYIASSFAALKPWRRRTDGQTSIGYFAVTGEIWVFPPRDAQLTSITIESEAGIFTGDPPLNLGGPLDIDTDRTISKTTLGSSFGRISFGSVAKRYLFPGFLLDDLTVTGSFADGQPLGDVSLIYLPEPSALVLLFLGAVGLLALSPGSIGSISRDRVPGSRRASSPNSAVEGLRKRDRNVKISEKSGFLSASGREML